MASTLVFLGSTPSNSSQLFSLGSTSGTATQTDITGYDSGIGGPVDITAFGGGEVFNGGALGAQELWSLNASGVASQITDASFSPSLDPLNITAVGSTLFFSGTDAAGNGDLYVSDGTEAGTRSIAALNAGSNGVFPNEIVAADGRVFFSGTDASGANDLWVSDGTAAGTNALNVANTDTQNIANMGPGLNPSNITFANGQIFFAGTDNTGNIGLWKSDGTAAGTTELNIPNAAPGAINPTSSNIVSFNGLTYFAGHDASGNIGLWVTDGTGSDTTELAISNSSINGLAPVSLTVFNGSLYFGGTDINGNTGLWKSDGTASGTSELSVSGTALGGLSPASYNISAYPNAPMAVFDNHLYFEGNGADGTQDLWSSDGTGAGTVQVSTPDANGTSSGVMPTDFFILGEQPDATTSYVKAISPAAPPIVIGSGHDAITFMASESTVQGSDLFTVSVDGVQVGGVLAETALRSQSQSQQITLNGDWGDGTHTLSINFLNGSYDGNPILDPKLYVSGVSYDGVSSSGSLALMSTGPQLITIGTDVPRATTIGSGSDKVTLQMSEDAYLGDSQFIATVDGVQIGGVQTVVASRSAGQSQEFDLLGNFGAGPHTVSITFLNDASGATVIQDRNLYVDSTSYNGVLVAQGALAEFNNGTQNIVTGTPAPAATSNVVIGTGPDTVTLKISEDAFAGNALYTVAVDGQTIGGTQTAQFSHAAGHDQTLTVAGNFGAGQHQVTVDFLNDAGGPNIATEDRNLYVDGATYDGSPNAGGLALMSGGPQTITVGTPISTSTTWLGSGYDTIGLKISEDFFQGNAQFTVAVDGAQIGGVQIATAIHSQGQDQTFNIAGNFGAGQHTVSLNFLNDDYAGAPTADRNLYLDGAIYNGTATGSATLALMSAGTQSVTVGIPAQPVVNLGSGYDTIALKMSEDYFQGDAQFTVAVDGKTIGGMQSASALHSAAQDTTFNLMGNFGGGQHAVTVNFLNDASAGTPTTDRNLYVDGASYDGAATQGASLALMSGGPQTMMVGTAPSSPISLGSGNDTISLKLSEDFFQDNAQFTVAVDGTQIGGVQTATALHSQGQEQIVNLSGNFGAGQHQVSVDFLNDAYAGSAALDRNLYVDGATYNGTADSPETLALMKAGTQSVTVGIPAQPVVNLGSGYDTIALKMSEDYFQGDAQFTVAVDGKTIGGVQSASALHSAAQDTTFNLMGNFGGGQHAVTVNFLNDASAGTPTTDRNLYVDGASYDGAATQGASLALMSGGPQTMMVGTAPSSPISLGSGNDTISLKLSEDFFQDNAQFTVAVDGTQIGGVQTATALHSQGQEQIVNLSGNFGAGQHQVSVDFLNDAYAGSAALDRNLYLDSASYDGSTSSGASLTLLHAGTQSLTVGNSAAAVTTIGSGTDTIGLKVSEDFYQGDAQFTLSVDGKEVGGIQTATAQHGLGQDQTLNVLGSFGSGSHVVTLDFLNDAYGPTGDRNLYVDGTTYDGKTVANGTIGIPAAVPGSIPIPGADTLTLGISEDAYLGDAQFDVYVDGRQVGGTLTTTALHAAGQSQIFNLSGSWGAGGHTVGVVFLNDAYGGSPNLDRNLYVDSLGFNGATTLQHQEIGGNGGVGFNVTTATTYNPGAAGGAIATLGNDTVNVGTAFETVSTYGPTTLVNGGSGGLSFFGNTGIATVTGGSGTNNLVNSGGSLNFIDGTGATSITAGSSHELYTIINGQAGNTLDLYGFNPNNDKVHLQGFSGTGIASQQIVNGSTQIILADSTRIVLHGVANLSESQIFA